ncbi:hypothetical protein [Microbacterium aurum]
MNSSDTRNATCGMRESMSSIQAIFIACDPPTTNAMSTIVIDV